MSPTSVLAVVNDYPAPSETFVQRKLVGLKSGGIDVSITATRFHPGAELGGVQLVPRVPWVDVPNSMRSLATPAGRRLARAEIEALLDVRRDGPNWRRRLLLAPVTSVGAQIVHFEFSGIAVNYLDLLELLRPAKLAVSCRGSAEKTAPLRDPGRLARLRDVFERVDLIHCVSDDMRATVEGYGAPTAKILVNRPAIQVADFAPLSERRNDHDGPFRLVSIGRLHWYKGLDDALRSVAGLRARGHDVDYRIVGEGPEREKLEFLRRELDLEDSVNLLGTQNQDAIRDHLAWADALLLPSLSEGISNAALEAMASGLPVISTDCGGMTEVITDGEDGFVVHVGDTEALAERLAALATDPDLRHRIGAAAAARAATEFDLSRQIRVFVDAYDQLLHR